MSATDLGGLRLAVVNWRDPWHPQAGGAERYAWEMARALVSAGAQVRFLTARARGQARREERDGIEIIRVGGKYTVYLRALTWMYGRRLFFDAVIDCQNGIPFFTPLVLPPGVPVLCVVHHVHTDQFGVHFPRWMANAGRFLEGPVARRVYRHHACVAVSPSTVTAMRERLGWTGDIYLIPNGTPPEPLQKPKPAGNLVWVGRLVAHKRAGLLLPLAERLKLRHDGVAIDVVGRGPAEASLAAEVAARGLEPFVRLHGYLAEEDKQALVAGSLLHLNTSQGEGWGLCVLEAAACGVPTVAYDVDGLRDAIHDGETGWLVKEGQTLEDVVEAALTELSDPKRRAAIAAACRRWAAQLDWGRSTERMTALVGACVSARTSLARRREAWIIEGPGEGMLAEGPLLDALINSGATVRRPATPLERLTGAGQPP
jgi:glycosyltransferase involved in cell wall biosynthesis